MQDPIQRHPTRAEQLDILVAILTAAVPAGGRVLDLGCGTGYLGHLLLAARPDLRFVGVDRKAEALAEAARNLAGFATPPTLIEADLGRPAAIPLPDGPVDAVVSVLTFHDLSDAAKRDVLAWAAARLTPAGLLLVLDRIRLAEPALFGAQQAVWRRLERLHGQGMRGAADFAAYLADLGTDNRPAALADYLAWLRLVGLRAACLHLHGNIALVGGARGEAAALA